jgi:D-sedoheptulose 7-phosphate isomerase
MKEISDSIAGELNAAAELMQHTIVSGVPTVVSTICVEIISGLSRNGKILLAGNGGSAADAQHMAAEFVNYFSFPRAPLAAIALTTDSSVLTSISNDSSFDYVFSRQVSSIGNPGDILWLYSTSGSSKNIVEAAKVAKEMGIKVIFFTGDETGTAEAVSDLVVSVPSSSTPKIQEVHLVLGHAISGIVEERMFGKSTS